MSGPVTEPREALAVRAKEIERTTRHNFSSEGRLAHEAALIAVNLAAGVHLGDEGLREALERLAPEDPPVVIPERGTGMKYPDAECRECGFVLKYEPRHAPDCAWVQARAALATPEDPTDD